VIIASIYHGFSAQAMFVLDTIKLALENPKTSPDQINILEVRDFLDAAALMTLETNAWQELGIGEPGKTKPKPDICLFWLPTEEQPPPWASSLLKKMLSEFDKTFLVWIYWDIKDNKNYQMIFNHPLKQSFLLNLSNPSGWSAVSGLDDKSWISFLTLLKHEPKSTNTTLFAWLHSLMSNIEDDSMR